VGQRRFNGAVMVAGQLLGLAPRVRRRVRHAAAHSAAMPAGRVAAAQA
jgi:hypothetical protein